jgi:hypothetical protein
MLALSGCGSNTNNAPSAPAEQAGESYTWGAIAPSTVTAGPPAQLSLAQGYGYALLAQTAVQPGDAVTARYSLQGTAGKYVRVMIQRHCNTEAGDAYHAQDVLLTGEPQQGQIALTFAEAYDCIRLSFVSNGFQPMEVTVLDLDVTKSAAGG